MEYVYALHVGRQYLWGRFRVKGLGVLESPAMAAPVPAESHSGTVQIKVTVPTEVAQWLEERAQENFKARPTYIRDLLVQLFHRRNG